MYNRVSTRRYYFVMTVTKLEDPAPVPFGRRKSRVVHTMEDDLPDRLKNGKKMIPKFPIHGDKRGKSARGSKSQPTANKYAIT